MSAATVVGFDDSGVEVLVAERPCPGCGTLTSAFYLTLDTTISEDGHVDFSVLRESTQCCGHTGPDPTSAPTLALLVEHLNSCPAHADQRRENRPRT